MSQPNSPRSRWLRTSLFGLVLAGLAIGAWMALRHTHTSADHAHHPAEASPDHHHHHPDEASAVMTLNEGRRWETDLPLQTGMQRIRSAAEQGFAAHASGQLTPAAATALSAAVQENVNNLIANCQLTPKADATLHVIIAELLTGAGQLADKSSTHDGLEKMERALRQYSEYFDHPGWVPFDSSKV